MLWLILGSLGAVLSGMLFFMLTAFGGGGLTAPGRPPRGLAWCSISLIAGPIACAVFGLLPWFTGRYAWFAGPPLLVVAQVCIILVLFGRH